MIAIVDYGVGNIFSLASSFSALGEDIIMTSDEKVIRSCERIVLPGVGAFGDAITRLRSNGLDEVVKEEAKCGKPILGVCLGMQMLFDKSFEYGENNGLSLIGGMIIPMTGTLSKDLKVPHIGWNALHFQGEKHKLFKYINDNDYVYFVHSFFATECSKDVIATVDYGREITAAVAKDNVMGCQFHPEKSGSVGLKILKAFCEIDAGGKR